MAVLLSNTRLYSVSETDIPVINDMLDQLYWNDNGSDADGSAWLIEVKDLTPEQRRQLGLGEFVGMRLDGYDCHAHFKTLDSPGVAWTGWQAEGYALINARIQDVKRTLDENAGLHAREELRALDIVGTLMILPEERRAYLDTLDSDDTTYYQKLAAHFQVAFDGKDKSVVDEALFGRYEALLPVVEVK